MRAAEFLNETEEIAEIVRIPKDEYQGGKQSLYDKQYGKQIKKLPGGSGLMYSIGDGRYNETDIKLWDPNGKDYIKIKADANEPSPERQPRESQRSYESRLWDWKRTQRDSQVPGQLIGKLSISDVRGFPLRGAVQVDTITVDEDYRGMGIAKALYGIVLTIMKRPLLAGSAQTPGGRRNWVSLSSIPGVQMKGYVLLGDDELDTSDDGWEDPKVAEKNIDTLMGKLGGQHIGTSRSGVEYFAFDVKPNTTGRELEAHINTKLSKVYGGSDISETGLYAVWTGQAVSEDMSRRGFLGGLAGLAGAGLTGSSPRQPAAPTAEPVAKKEPVPFQPLGKKPELETYIKKVAESAGITGVELAQFLAQAKHETWDFTRLSEVPKGPSYFAKKYDPKHAPRIAKILGNLKIGDGAKFRGRGFVQLTGRDNYTRAQKALGLPLLEKPELAANPEIAAKIAVWFWNTRVKPSVTDFTNTTAVTKKINPGLSGLENRHDNFIKYQSMF